MDEEDKIEREAIELLVSQKYSNGYLRAVAAGIPVTFLDGTDIVLEHNGERTVIAHVRSCTKLHTPKIYTLN